MHSTFSGYRWSLALIVAAGTALAVAGPAQPPAERPQTSPDPSRPQPEPGRQGQPGGPRPDPRNVEGAMKLINRSLRQLNAQVGDTSKKEENLKLVGDAERGAVLAKGMEPEKTPKDGRDKYLKNFRTHQIELIGMLLELETDILNDKTAEAKAMMAKLATYRDTTHKEFDIHEDADGKGWTGGRPPRGEGARPEEGKK